MGDKTYVALITFLIVAIITFLLCLLAVKVGNKFLEKFSSKATAFGGIILIVIALKIIITIIVGIF